MIQKIAFVALLFVFSVLNSSAQIAKGSILIGGSFSLRNNDFNSYYNNSKLNNFNISVGKAFKENIVYGVNLGYYSYSYDYPNSGVSGSITTSKVTLFSLGGYYRNYRPIAKDFYFFVETGAVIGLGKTTDSYSSINSISSSNQTAISFYITPGLSYNISKKLQLEINLPNFINAQFNNTSYDQSLTSTNIFSISSSLSSGLVNNLGVGFHLIL